MASSSLILLEPGRVCAAGSFGRTWIGTVSLDPAAENGTVRVAHTARESVDAVDAQQRARTTVAVGPDVRLVLRAKPGANGKVGRRVLIRRVTPSHNPLIHRHSLLFDPDSGTAEVMRDDHLLAGRATNRWTAASGGPVYFPAHQRHGPDVRVVLHRLDFPGVVNHRPSRADDTASAASSGTFRPVDRSSHRGVRTASATLFARMRRVDG